MIMQYISSKWPLPHINICNQSQIGRVLNEVGPRRVATPEE